MDLGEFVAFRLAVVCNHCLVVLFGSFAGSHFDKDIAPRES